ncbi:MAG: DNA-directed RNA polymerase subunit beta', partial [Gammaproteobacteria bacterium]|nr:DNA-directed RNA polymerase subunit beta' [Gammaproteobacteria bacterium]
TADSGYLTRRLVDVSQDVVVREYDCGTDKGFMVSAVLDDDNKVMQSLSDRTVGRFAYKDCIDPLTGEVIVKKGEYITEEKAQEFKKHNITEVGIRTVCTCNAKSGICVKCYGRNLATSDIVEVGEAVGIIASQSIGEPGTQLTMRTFHTGGLAGGDITSGLPRVAELFEARPPKGEAVIADFAGKVTALSETEITVKGNLDEQTYALKPGYKVLVNLGSIVKAGEALTKGSINLRQLLKATNVETVQQYIIKEVQKVYAKEGVPINDKHVEIIVRQMTKRLNVKLEGDTDLLPGQLVSSYRFNEANKNALISGNKPAVAMPILLGITKAALRSESFLSAASFQETTRVLTDACLRGQTDYLQGLKENVIIGGLIPAGTGILKDTKFEYEGPREEEEIEDSFEDFNI